MRKLPIIVQTFALAFTLGAAKADDGLKLDYNKLPQETTRTLTTDAKCNKFNLVVGLDLGTQGVGLELKTQPFKNFSFRVGGSVLPGFKVKSNFVSGLDVNSQVTYKTDITNFRLLVDWHTPFLRVIDFKITGGIAYFAALGSKGHLVPQGQYYYGSIALSPEDVGYVDIDVDYKNSIAPYLGVSLFHTMPAKRVNLNLDLGTYLLPKPSVTMLATGFLSGNESNQPIIENNLKGYRWFPLAQVSVNYRLF